MKKPPQDTAIQLRPTLAHPGFTSRMCRRRFLAVSGLAVAALATTESFSATAPADNIRLGMMLQGNSMAELLERAKAIAAAGFDSVQVSFFFHPTEEDLRTLAKQLTDLKLKTVAFGTYFNPLRPNDTSFMGSSQAGMKQVAAHAGLFNCKQFVTWSGNYSKAFAGEEPRNHTPEAIAQVQRAIREVLLPILEPLDGRVALEPYYKHILGTVESAEAILAPFPAQRVGLLLDPPNFISPALHSQREEEMRRLFRELGSRIHFAHFKDLKLNPTGQEVELPGPGGGEMNYKLLVSEIRKLQRPMPCIIEHISAETAQMAKTKTWVEQQLRQD
jgi:sugar phosphate isomerase/epimerase